VEDTLQDALKTQLSLLPR